MPLAFSVIVKWFMCTDISIKSIQSDLPNCLHYKGKTQNYFSLVKRLSSFTAVIHKKLLGLIGLLGKRFTMSLSVLKARLQLHGDINKHELFVYDLSSLQLSKCILSD